MSIKSRDCNLVILLLYCYFLTPRYVSWALIFRRRMLFSENRIADETVKEPRTNSFLDTLCVSLIHPLYGSCQRNAIVQLTSFYDWWLENPLTNHSMDFVLSLLTPGWCTLRSLKNATYDTSEGLAFHHWSRNWKFSSHGELCISYLYLNHWRSP